MAQLTKTPTQSFIALFKDIKGICWNGGGAHNGFDFYRIKPQKKVERADGKLSCRLINLPFFRIQEFFPDHPKNNQEDQSPFFVGKRAIFQGYFDGNDYFIPTKIQLM